MAETANRAIVQCKCRGYESLTRQPDSDGARVNTAAKRIRPDDRRQVVKEITRLRSTVRRGEVVRRMTPCAGDESHPVLLVLTNIRLMIVDRDSTDGPLEELPTADLRFVSSEPAIQRLRVRSESQSLVADGLRESARRAFVQDLRLIVKTNPVGSVGVSEAELIEDLEENIDALKTSQHQRQFYRRVIAFVGIAIVVACPVVAHFTTPQVAFGSIYGLLFILIVALTSDHRLEETIRTKEMERDLRALETQSDHQGAYQLFRIHQAELKRYYDQTLTHAQVLYVVGVLCLVLGFAVIGVTLWLLVDPGRLTEADQRIVVAIIGGAGAVLANFIAVVYLRMYSDTISSLTAFHGRLVGTHHLHFANFLAATVSDQDSRDKTLSEMAVALAKPAPDAALG